MALQLVAAARSGDEDMLRGVIASLTRRAPVPRAATLRNIHARRRRKASVVDVLRKASQGGETALHAAAAAGHTSVVRLLLHLGSDHLQRDADDRTPIEVAKSLSVIAEFDRFKELARKARAAGHASVAAYHATHEKARANLESASDICALSAAIRDASDAGTDDEVLAAAEARLASLELSAALQASEAAAQSSWCTDYRLAALRTALPPAKAAGVDTSTAERRLAELTALETHAHRRADLRSAMCEAAGKDDVPSICRLADVHGVEIDCTHQGSLRALCALGHLRQPLTDADDDPRRRFTPLRLASMYGCARAVKELLERGASVDAVDGYDQSALAYAATNCHVSVCAILLAYGADVHRAPVAHPSGAAAREVRALIDAWARLETRVDEMEAVLTRWCACPTEGRAARKFVRVFDEGSSLEPLVSTAIAAGALLSEGGLRLGQRVATLREVRDARALAGEALQEAVSAVRSSVGVALAGEGHAALISAVGGLENAFELSSGCLLARREVRAQLQKGAQLWAAVPPAALDAARSRLCDILHEIVTRAADGADADGDALDAAIDLTERAALIEHTTAEPLRTYLRTHPLHELREMARRTRERQSLGVRAPPVPPEFLCPISREMMVDPVCTCDGFTYERAEIQSWFEHSQKAPLTGETLASRQLIPNHTLKQLMRDYHARDHERLLRVVEDVEATHTRRRGPPAPPEEQAEPPQEAGLPSYPVRIKRVKCVGPSERPSGLPSAPALKRTRTM